MSTLVTNTICMKLESDFDAMNSQLSKLRKAAKAPINNLKTQIQALKYSAVEALESVAGELHDNIDNYTPKFNDQDKIDEMTNIINSCTYLQNVDIDILKMIRLVNDAANNMIDDLINPLISSLGEFDIAKLLNQLMKNFNVWDLSNLIQNLLNVLDCIESICGRDVSLDIAEIESLMADMYALSDGNMDTTSLYGDLGLIPSQIYNINKAYTSYSELMTKTQTNIQEGINFIKNISL